MNKIIPKLKELLSGKGGQNKGVIIILHVHVDKDRNMILIPFKRAKAGFGLASEPYEKISSDEWENASVHIAELMEKVKEQPFAEENGKDVMKEICGGQGFRQFSKKHICISVHHVIGEKTYTIHNMPRLSDGSYGAEAGTISEKYCTEFISADDIESIQENFMKAFREAEQYLEQIGGRLSEGKIEHCFGYKTAWFAFKGADINTILQSCPKLINAKQTTWEEGMHQVEDSGGKAFLSGAYSGWTFLVGMDMCDPSQPEELISLLLKFGEIAEKVCYFASHRTVALYCFARVDRGRIVRLYSYLGESGQVLKNIGERTKAEKDLSLNFATRDEDLFEEGFTDMDEEHILQLAEKWSLGPGSLSGKKEQRCVIAEIRA